MAYHEVLQMVVMAQERDQMMMACAAQSPEMWPGAKKKGDSKRALESVNRFFKD